MSLNKKERKALADLTMQLAKMDSVMQNLQKNYTLVQEATPYPDGSVIGTAYKLENTDLLTSEHTRLPLHVEYINQVDWLGLGFTRDANPREACKLVNRILDGELI